MGEDRLADVVAAVREGAPARGVPWLGERLAALSFTETQQLHRRLRGFHGLGPGPGWTPGTVAELAEWPLLACATCHHDGYVRDAAVDRLAASSEPAILPFLLFRATDWVPAIRERASAMVRARMDVRHVERWFAAWPYLGQNWGYGIGALREPVLTLMLSPAARAQLLSTMQSGGRAARAAVLAVLDQTAVTEGATLVDAAMRSPDPVVANRGIRIRLQQLAAPHVPDEEKRTVSENLYRRTRGRGRALALQAWLAAGGAPDDATLREALVDRYTEVRQLARFHIARQHLAIDVLAAARAAVTRGRSRYRRRAVLILAESGERRPEVFRALSLPPHPGRVREAAYEVLDELDPSFDDDARVTLLEDPVRCVARTGWRRLRRHGVSPRALARVRSLAEDSAASSQTRELARSLLAALLTPRGQPQ